MWCKKTELEWIATRYICSYSIKLENVRNFLNIRILKTYSVVFYYNNIGLVRVNDDDGCYVRFHTFS